MKVSKGLILIYLKCPENCKSDDITSLVIKPGISPNLENSVKKISGQSGSPKANECCYHQLPTIVALK